MTRFDELDLPEPEDVVVERSTGQVVRLAASLVGAGVGAALIIALAVWFFGGLAQSEAGLCRATWVPCTSLSVASVEQLSGVDLPDDTTVVSGYAQEYGGSTTFRAEVVLPTGEASPLSSSYEELEGEWPDIVPAAPESGLSDLTYWWIEAGFEDSIAAAEGTDSDGNTVILFDSRISG
ncbi:MAG: hypothetical protein ACOH19_02555 [Rhodoglobus sp.]